MPRRFPPRLFAIASLGWLAVACGGTDPAPSSPREARFDVNPGPGDPTFTVVEIRSVDTIHQPAPLPPATSFSAPHSFFFENAHLPIQGIFEPTTAQSVSDVQLL